MNRQKSAGSLSSLTASSASLTASNISLNSKNFQNSEIKDLTKQLHIKEEQVNKFYDIAPDEASNQTTKEQILYALKLIKVVKQDLADPKQNLANEIKELCDNLNDHGICVTYVIANSRKSSKEILKLLSPYLLKNANDLGYIEQYIPNVEACIKESNKNEAMELLAQPKMIEYLEQKSAKLEGNSPTSPPPPPPFPSPSSTDMEEDSTATGQDIKAVVEDSTATEQDIKAVVEDMVEVTGESPVVG